MTCGLILAAGESRRMGSPKALLEFQGETFLDRLIGLFTRRCSPVIAVLGARQETVRAGLRRAGEALLVENRNFHLGQLASMQCGLRAVPADAGGVLFTLVDHPAVAPESVAALHAILDAAKQQPKPRLRRSAMSTSGGGRERDSTSRIRLSAPGLGAPL